MGGHNVFSFAQLQLQALGTELMVRLNTKGLVGDVFFFFFKTNIYSSVAHIAYE
jgi:hypothetical protein